MNTCFLSALGRWARVGALLSVMWVSACVYKVPIQQGNLLEAKDIAQIKTGMTPSQVRYVLGTPLVVDPFTKDRWDYVYYRKVGRMMAPEQRHLIVYFENGSVSRIENVTPASG